MRRRLENSSRNLQLIYGSFNFMLQKDFTELVELYEKLN